MAEELDTKNILIFTKRPCPYCDRAKAFFRERAWSFQETDLTGNFDEMDKLKQRTGHMTFPQIFFGDQFIGGYTDLIARFSVTD